MSYKGLKLRALRVEVAARHLPAEQLQIRKLQSAATSPGRGLCIRPLLSLLIPKKTLANLEITGHFYHSFFIYLGFLIYTKLLTASLRTFLAMAQRNSAIWDQASIPKRTLQQIETMLPALYQAVMDQEQATVHDMLFSRKFPIDRAILRCAAVYSYHKPIFEHVALCLAERRSHLLSLARRYLLGEQLRTMGVKPQQRLLDTQSGPVSCALLKSGHLDHDSVRYFIPDRAWASNFTSIYCLVGCNQEAADIHLQQ
ncbi:hypothetical protein BJY04DRAFT_179405 [Aspergillus karnatakaensis]|uniref:uncharacterized protein n=1 Tax=Aspergillus karnatakaensis TaxID=1810916 RepID=UPI003CCD14A3